ncbi:MAG: hypothetical protein JWP44_4232 [Mucilaginibacter sp.]|jgi:cytochrome b561|nr:hypothetical protein [Mucilaginibacter sp.]
MTSDRTLSLAVAKMGPSGDPLRYDRTTILLHWITAFLVIALFTLGETWGYVSRPWQHVMIVSHLSFGIVLSVLIPVRLLWRWTRGTYISDNIGRWDDLAAKAVEGSLYAIMIALAVIGYVWRWGNGQAMSFFGLLIDPPFSRLSHETVGLLRTLHSDGAWLLIVLAFGHAGAALFHARVLKNTVLQRML